MFSRPTLVGLIIHGPGGTSLKFHVDPNFQSIYFFNIEFDHYQNGPEGMNLIIQTGCN